MTKTDHARHFTFSILRVFGPCTSSSEVDAAEARYKRALLTATMDLTGTDPPFWTAHAWRLYCGSGPSPTALLAPEWTTSVRLSIVSMTIWANPLVKCGRRSTSGARSSAECRARIGDWLSPLGTSLARDSTDGNNPMRVQDRINYAWKLPYPFR